MVDSSTEKITFGCSLVVNHVRCSVWVGGKCICVSGKCISWCVLKDISQNRITHLLLTPSNINTHYTLNSHCLPTHTNALILYLYLNGKRLFAICIFLCCISLFVGFMTLEPYNAVFMDLFKHFGRLHRVKMMPDR